MEIKQPRLIPDDNTRAKVEKALNSKKSKNKKIVGPFKGFCKTAERGHHKVSVRRYLKGLIAENISATPLQEYKQLSKQHDEANQEVVLQEDLQVLD